MDGKPAMTRIQTFAQALPAQSLACACGLLTAVTAACHRDARIDPSVQIAEKRQRSVTEDPAVSGDFPIGWQAAVGERASPPQLPPEEDELAEFAKLYGNTKAPRIVEEELAPGATRTVDLQVTAASGLAGSARWIGTSAPLKVTIVLDGSTLSTGTAASIGTNRGASFLRARTTAAGRAALSVTNTSAVRVRVRILFLATASERKTQ